MIFSKTCCLKPRQRENFKSSKRKVILTLKEIPLRLAVGFLEDTLKSRREWDDIFKMLKENNCQPGILYPEKLCFRNEVKTKDFHTQEFLLWLSRLRTNIASLRIEI